MDAENLINGNAVNPKLAQKLEKVLTVTASSTVGFITAFALTGSFVHGFIVMGFCVAMFYWLTL